MQIQEYDIIIIGGGSAGLGALGMAQKLGWKPLLIDKEEAHIGGDCLNFGCVPSKALIHLAKQFHGARKASQFGMQVEGKADMGKILSYVHSKQAVIRHHENADYIRAQGVDLEIGVAQFVNDDTVQIGEKHFTSKRILIATGSRPRHIPFKGMDKVKVYTNENLFYEMDTLPDRLLVVGGGAIGCEMAQVFQRFGSQVTLVNRGSRILKNERADYSEVLTQQSEKEGIQVLNNTNLLEFTNSHTALIENKESGKTSQEFDAVLIAIGRVLNVEDLQLAKGGIELTERGKPVLDDYLRSTNKRVFFSGDVAGMYQFSHGSFLGNVYPT